MGIRHGFAVAMVLGLGLATFGDAGAAEPQRQGPGRGQGRGGMGMMEPGMSAEEMGNIHRLVQDHRSITREVAEVPGGIIARTTTSNPELVPVLRAHVRQMERRLHGGRPVRMWDPVFRGIFEHAGAINLYFVDVDGGIEVAEISDDPVAVLFIREHARKVSLVAADGPDAVRPPWAGGPRRRSGR